MKYEDPFRFIDKTQTTYAQSTN